MMYLLMVIERKQKVDFFGNHVTVNLNWAEGMIGACAVFNNREAAEKYRGKKTSVPIYEVGEVDNG